MKNEEYVEPLLRWMLTHGDKPVSVSIDIYSDDRDSRMLYTLYWAGLLDRDVNIASLTHEFRINQAGLDLLKEDL